MTEQEKNMEDYKHLQEEYLAEAEDMFGRKTDYTFIGVFYHNHPPRMMHHDTDFITGEQFFKIELCGKAINDRKDGIFQLSHEVVHLLSPLDKNDDANDANYLEEGMAVYFSELVTIRETNDQTYSKNEMEKHREYLKAYQLFSALMAIDKNAVRTLRLIQPVIAWIQPADFVTARINAPADLIEDLLAKFIY